MKKSAVPNNIRRIKTRNSHASPFNQSRTARSILSAPSVDVSSANHRRPRTYNLLLRSIPPQQSFEEADESALTCQDPSMPDL